ncbi:hypothetical protein KI688_005144 [Linnemannia hyalina]|uniref:Uncharacterized protein n=1 Tax=Linnemannia hyalina TaxID=64524 RepID=A0A9P7XLR8_9FUNG|nr:hypothetical protein KI688_005144 [Linnemannia hyalina]
MSGQGFFGKDKDRSRRDDSPSSSPSTSKLASKGWVGKMAFLYSKRKPSLPLQSHYLSLPVGGAAAATSPIAGTGGMYMLHSEDLSVTEFAKLAGITIVQDEDDPTTYDSQFIGNEIHENCRRGSSTTELTPPPSGGLLGPEYVTLGSAGNTLNSEGNLTVGSNGSFGGGSLRRTQIWDPQFWSDPVRDGAAMTSTNAMVSNNNMFLPSASTLSLPITSGSFLTRPRAPAPVGSSAPNSPRLKPQSSLPSSGLSYGASPPSSSSRLGPASTPLTLSPPVPTHEQRRRNSCSPAVLMPAAGSRATATAGSEIDRARHLTSSGVLSLKRADQQQQQQLPRPGNKDAIQLSQDLGRRPSFTSLTAIALELEGGSGESGEASDVQDVLQAGGAAVGGDPAATTSTPRLFLEPSTPITPTKNPQLTVPPAPPSMSHTLAMHALHTPRSRGSVPAGSGGGHSSRSGVSRTRSPSPSPLSRQIDLNSMESPQEERCDPLDMQWKQERTDDSLAQLSPPPLVTPPPAASKSSRQNLAHGRSGKNATKPSTTTKGLGSANMHLTETAIPTSIGPAAHHHQRGKSMPLSLSDQQLTNNTQHRRPPQACTPPPPPSSSASSTPASSSRSNSPNPSSSGRTFTPGTKVGRFTLVQERCTKHVDLLQAQQAQRRASLGEMGMLSNGTSGEKKGVYLSPASSSSTFSLTEDAVLDPTEWVENPMLKPEDNVRVFQRKRSRRILDPLPQSQPQPQYSLTPPPPVSY